MAVVLAIRPWGLLGKPIPPPPVAEQRDLQVAPARRFVLWAIVIACALAAAPLVADDYSLVLLIDIFVFALFAASLQLIMGIGGMASFGHAAYLGLGAYAAALLAKRIPMEATLIVAPLVAAFGALVCGWFCVRRSGVYLAMLTLAFAQIVWSMAYQWDAVTGGSNGLLGVWPPSWLSTRTAYYMLTLGITIGAIAVIWRISFSPFGYALRASRDSPPRAAAIGIEVRTMQWAAFVLAGAFAGLAGTLYAFAKGSISPETLGIPRSIDALVMVLLGGLQTVAGPVAGATVLVLLQDTIARHTEYWRAILGAAILAIAVLLPHGIVGSMRKLVAQRWVRS